MRSAAHAASRSAWQSGAGVGAAALDVARDVGRPRRGGWGGSRARRTQCGACGTPRSGSRWTPARGGCARRCRARSPRGTACTRGRRADRARSVRGVARVHGVAARAGKLSAAKTGRLRQPDVFVRGQARGSVAPEALLEDVGLAGRRHRQVAREWLHVAGEQAARPERRSRVEERPQLLHRDPGSRCAWHCPHSAALSAWPRRNGSTTAARRRRRASSVR